MKNYFGWKYLAILGKVFPIGRKYLKKIETFEAVKYRRVCLKYGETGINDFDWIFSREVDFNIFKYVRALSALRRDAHDVFNVILLYSPF